MELDKLIQSFNTVSAKLAEANSKVDELKYEKQELQERIINALHDSGLDAAAADGKTVQIVKKKQYSILDFDAFTALDDVYHTGSLFSVNSNKLNSFCKDLEATFGEMPEDICSTLKTFEYETLSVRKIK